MTEFFDIVDEAGQPTGKIISRVEAHQKGTLHRTAHVWLVKEKPGGYDILLQKRSEEKDSFPGMYDTSSAGHILAGDEPLPSALRELKEELGLEASPEELKYAGTFRIQYENEHKKQGRVLIDIALNSFLRGGAVCQSRMSMTTMISLKAFRAAGAMT